MGVKPNLVVGAVGAVVLLLAGTLIAYTWEDLTGTATYQATVETFARSLGDRSGGVGPGGSVSGNYTGVPANLTRFAMRLTWDENAITGVQHDVTLTLFDPARKPQAEQTSRGGVAGITLEKPLRDPPAPSRFTATADGIQSRFDARYPSHDETAGNWTYRIQANTPSQPGATGITYRVSFAVDWYRVDLAKVEGAELTK